MDDEVKSGPEELRVGEYVSTSDTEKAFPLFTVDLSGLVERQVVIASGTEETYQGHPTTLLLPDGKTILCTWTQGHGGACGFLKRSSDGGKTWSELVDVPPSWTQSSNCPVLFRLPDPNGVCSLFVYAGSGPDGCIQVACSRDEGLAWSDMRSTGVSAVMPFCAIVPVEGGRRLLGLTNARRIHKPEGMVDDQWSNIIVKSYSEDGGFTWSPWEVVLDNPDYRYCEPCLVFPENVECHTWICLLRENRHGKSYRIVTEDEGATWSAPEELPVGLHGDRHIARYTRDGRLVVAFRDRAGSGTAGHFVAWVGRWQDVLDRGEGGYRIKLLHNYAGFDCGYPGLECLPDGTLVATTYLKYRDDTCQHSVVCTRFSLAETDALLNSENA